MRDWLGVLALMPLLAPSPVTARPVGEAQDRCLTYGFRDDNNIARCAEYELQFPDPKHWGLQDISHASNVCLRLGFTGDPLAACVQRQLRSAEGQPRYEDHTGR